MKPLQGVAESSSNNNTNNRGMKKSSSSDGTSKAVGGNIAQDLAKRSLISINELNSKFMHSNVYFVLVTAILYIGIGVGIYHHIMRWDRLDALYFLVITVLTIGYGDFTPISEHERLFTAFYIIIGIAVCGSALGTVLTLVQSHQERVTKLRNIRAMLLMKEEEKSNNSSRHNSIVSGGGHFSNASSAIAFSSLQDAMTVTNNHQNHFNRSMTGDAAEEDDEESKDHDFSPSSKVRPLSTYVMDIVCSISLATSSNKKTLKDLKDASLLAFDEDYKALWRATAIDFTIVFIILIVGMGGMMAIEGWTSVDGFYWATVTIMTVGYGDLVPTSTSGRWFTIIYALCGCAFMTKLLTDCIKYPLLARVLKNEQEVAQQFTGDLSPQMLTAIFDSDLYRLIPELKRSTDQLERAEFVLLVLQLMNKVEEKDIFLATKLFDDLNPSRSGILSQQEMADKLTEAQRREEIAAAAAEAEKKEQEDGDNYRGNIFARSMLMRGNSLSFSGGGLLSRGNSGRANTLFGGATSSSNVGPLTENSAGTMRSPLLPGGQGSHGDSSQIIPIRGSRSTYERGRDSSTHVASSV